MTDRAKLTKVLDGQYRLGDFYISRNGRKYWFLTSYRLAGWPRRYRTRHAAELAARVYLGETITDAEYAVLKGGSI